MTTLNNEDLFKQIIATDPSNSAIFPQVSLSQINHLRTIQSHLYKNPAYLRQSHCPYDPRTKAFLEEIFKSQDADETQIASDVAEYFKSNDPDENISTYDILIRDAKRAYLTLSRLGQKMEESPKPEEQLNRVKTMSQLQERLMAVIEKAEGFKQIQQFKRTVMEIVEKVLSSDQRTQVMEQLAESLKN